MERRALCDEGSGRGREPSSVAMRSIFMSSQVEGRPGER